MSPEEALSLWERGAAEDPLGGAVALLAGDKTTGGEEAVTALPIGERVRRALFGDDVEAVTECPACGETMELQWSLDALDALDGAAPRGGGRTVVRVGEEAVELRGATSADVRYALEMPDVGLARTALLERCLVNRDSSGRQLSTAAAARAASALGALDPFADMTVRLDCSACGHHWDAVFDIGAFLWTELDAWAHRVSREVHALASAYGWSEARILAMSPRRRALYLDLLSA